MTEKRVPIALLTGVLLVTVSLFSFPACRTQGMLQRGHWVNSGDDVIVIQAEGAGSSDEAYRRLVQALKEVPLEIDRRNPASHYVRTDGRAVNDSLLVRLNVRVTDSTAIELSGETRRAADPERETSWSRTAWNGRSLDDGWNFLVDVAASIGEIGGYREDPLTGTACGGCTCAAGEVCQNNVCRADEGQSTTAGASESCLSTKEAQLLSKIRAYREERGLPQVPVSSSLTRVARTHVRDLAAHEPHEGSLFGTDQCNLHSWSDEGPWSSCCYTPDHAEAQCMWKKPRELTEYTGRGFEIAARGVETAQQALSGWKTSRGHNSVLVNRGEWSQVEWEAVGVGMYEGYAVVWFGKKADPAGAPSRCTDESSQD